MPEICTFTFPTKHPDPHSDRNIPDEARGQVCGNAREYPEQAYCKRFGVTHDFTPGPKANAKILTDEMIEAEAALRRPGDDSMRLIQRSEFRQGARWAREMLS